MQTKTFTTELPIGLHEFATVYGRDISKPAELFTLKCLLADEKINHINTKLQNEFGILKRHAGSIISAVQGKLKSAQECRKNHIKVLTEKKQSLAKSLKKKKKRLSDYHKREKRYRKALKSKRSSKKAFAKPTIGAKNACQIQHHRTEVQQLRIEIHGHERRIHKLTQQIADLKKAPIHVNLADPALNFMFSGDAEQTYGNGVAKITDAGTLKIRVPYSLEERFGEWLEAPIELFYGAEDVFWATGAGKGSPVTIRFYAKDFRWFCAITCKVPRSKPQLPPVDWRYSGCVGVDLNEKSIDWAYVDGQGNLIEHGSYKLTGDRQINGKRSSQVKAILSDIACDLVAKAEYYQCPIVTEKLDFSKKKSTLREQGSRYARMLSGFAYRLWDELVSNRCANRGVRHYHVEPAYSSTIGLMKYCAMYGVSSGVAAGIVLARRLMKLSERLPASYGTYRAEEARKHPWVSWRNLQNQVIKGQRFRRHRSYLICKVNNIKRLNRTGQVTHAAVAVGSDCASQRTAPGKDGVEAQALDHQASHLPVRVAMSNSGQLCLDLGSY